MEWANAIVTNGSSLAVSVLNASGETSVIPTDALHSRGAPTATSYRRPTMRLRLSELERVEAGTYLKAFGLPSNQGAKNHAVFRWSDKGGAPLILPALVLMRAIFKPSKLLLKQMFRAQSLELCAVGERGPKASPRCVLQGEGEVGDVKYNPNPALRWFWRDERAWDMACSVHEHAMRGRLDIDLQDIEMELSMDGVATEQLILATKAYVRAVYLPAEDSSSEEVRMSLNGAALAGLSVAGKMDRLHVAVAASGRLATSQKEWAAVQQRLKPRRKCKLEGAQKEIFDGLLLKISGSIGRWVDLGRPGLSAHVHIGYYRKWLASGELGAMLEELRSLRCQNQ